MVKATTSSCQAASAVSSDELSALVINTAIGPIGIVESNRGLVAVRIGYRTKSDVRQNLGGVFSVRWQTSSPLAERIEDFADGKPDDFADVVLDTSHATGGEWTSFRDDVTRACRRVPYGQASCYSELARWAGSPKAARAVGMVMARNPYPIIVPCHRILRSDGSIGGFSSPHGIQFKRRLLQLEGAPAIGDHS